MSELLAKRVKCHYLNFAGNETEALKGAGTCWQSTQHTTSRALHLINDPVCLPLGRVICHLNGSNILDLVIL